MPNKRSRTDSAIPSREIKKQRRSPSIEDIPEVAIKREAEASSSTSNAAPLNLLPPALSDPLDDNGPEDTDTPEERVPCAECAEKLFIKGPGGRIIGPLLCNYSDEDDPCYECIRLGINCNHLMWPARETALEIQKMKPGQAALKATQALSARVKGVWEIHHQTDALLWELRNINRNVFRVVNELRESNSKRSLHLGFLEDWSEAWDEAKDKKDE